MMLNLSLPEEPIQVRESNSGYGVYVFFVGSFFCVLN